MRNTKALVFLACILFVGFCSSELNLIKAEPSVVVSIVFDDNYDTQLDYAWPLMRERGLVGTFYALTNTPTASPTPTPTLATKIYETDFESIIKTDDHHISIPLEHYFHTVGSGATFWMEDGYQRLSAPTPLSGARCLGMETVDSERVEFNIYDMETLVGEEYYVSLWYYFPSDWVVPASGWWSLGNPCAGQNDPWLPMVEVHPYDAGVFDRIALDSGGGPWVTLDGWDGLQPVGQWFKYAFYVKLDTINGEVRVWLNNEEILSANGIDTIGYFGNEILSTVAKIYGSEGIGTWRVWIDNLEIWDGIPPTPIPTPSPTPTPTASPTPTSTPQPNPTPSPTLTATPQPTPTPSPANSPTPTPTLDPESSFPIELAAGGIIAAVGLMVAIFFLKKK